VTGARTWILDQLEAERSRWMLWLPVALGLGIAVYYELPSEPALWLGPSLAAVALGLVFLARAGSLLRAVALGLFAVAVGFGLVTWRTASLAAPTLSRPLFSVNVEGRIADIQRLPDGVRAVLEAVATQGQRRAAAGIGARAGAVVIVQGRAGELPSAKHRRRSWSTCTIAATRAGDDVLSLSP
jgi:competence protein ComEC